MIQTTHTRRHKTWLIIILICVFIAAVLAYVSYGRMSDNLVYYLTPSELLAKGEKAFASTVRLGGIVAPGSIMHNQNGVLISFKVADNQHAQANTLTVHSPNHPPQMFRENIGVVVEGKLSKDLIFTADRVIVNHSNEYRAPQSGQDAKPHHGASTTVQ